MPTDAKRLRDLQRIGAKHAQRAGELEREVARLREALRLHHSMVLFGQQPSEETEAIYRAALGTEAKP